MCLRALLFVLLAWCTAPHAGLLVAQPRSDLATLEHNILDVFASKKFAAYPYASAQYLEFLRAAPEALNTADSTLVQQHLRYLQMIMPAGGSARRAVDNLLAGKGGDTETIVRWWRRSDTLPASANNERLQEHLSRIAYARENYAYPDDRRGVDDRGEVYIRLGAPSRNQVIKLSSAGVWLNPNSAKIPDNDFWVYRQIDKDAHYLFVRPSRRQPYQIATSEELLPRELIASRRHVGLLIPIMEEVFAQLALSHPHYGTTYDALNSYMNIPGYSGGTAYQFVRRLRNKIRLDDQAYERNRPFYVPAAFSNTLGDTAPLSPSIRWARFLEDDGTTRVEVYWGLRSSDLVPDRRRVRRLEREGHARTSRYLITFFAAHQSEDFVTRVVDAQHFSVSTTLVQGLRSQEWSTAVSEPLTHLAFQWEQRWANLQADGSVSPGAALKIGTHRLDSLRLLSSAPGTLELSDIKPLSMPLGVPAEDATIYPFDTLSHHTPLALHFEIYHLTYGADDRARYSVEYRVESADDPDRVPLAVQSSYTSESRRTAEHISLDLSTWDTRGPLRITVRVTDEVAGAAVERTIRFTFVT